MRVGILTGGGDCPGLNAVIRAAVRKGIFHHSDEFVGFIEGWRGVVENKTMPLTIETVSGILQLGGTILRTSRTNPRKMEGGIDKCLATIKANNLDALITIGGDDTLDAECGAQSECAGISHCGGDAWQFRRSADGIWLAEGRGCGGGQRRWKADPGRGHHASGAGCGGDFG